MQKNFVVIGAGSGIGRALAQMMAASGHQVFGTYRQSQSSIPGVELHHLDLNDESLDLSFVPHEVHGLAYAPGKIDLKPFGRLSEEDFIADYKLQVGGAIRVVQALLPNLKAAGSSSVVFFSTVAVQQGFNFHSLVSSSKGALEGLSRALAAEFAPSIRFNCVAPSLTDTPLAGKLLNTEQKKEANAQRHPLKRIGTAEDIAEAANFLLNETSSWMTGQVLPVDGGMSSLRI